MRNFLSKYAGILWVATLGISAVALATSIQMRREAGQAVQRLEGEIAGLRLTQQSGNRAPLPLAAGTANGAPARDVVQYVNELRRELTAVEENLESRAATQARTDVPSAGTGDPLTGRRLDALETAMSATQNDLRSMRDSFTSPGYSPAGQLARVDRIEIAIGNLQNEVRMIQNTQMRQIGP